MPTAPRTRPATRMAPVTWAESPLEWVRIAATLATNDALVPR